MPCPFFSPIYDSFHFLSQEAAENLRLADPTPDEQPPVDSKSLPTSDFVKQDVEKDANVNEKPIPSNEPDTGGTVSNENRSDSPVS